MLETKSVEIMELEDQYKNMFNWLSGAHIDFDYGDEDIISRYYSIEKNNNNRPFLKIGEACYKVISL